MRVQVQFNFAMQRVCMFYSWRIDNAYCAGVSLALTN